jgi:predicted dehydrogenase
MAEPITIAMLGCGRITARHSGILRTMAGARRVYASRMPGRAEAFNRRFGGHGACGDYRAALGATGVDVALVATPPDSHLEWTLAALAAGKHVIVEKPAFLHASDCDIVADAAAAAGRRVMVAENYRYRPLLRTMRELLASDVIGDLRLVMIDAVKQQAAPTWLDRPGMHGALWEGGIHWVHFLASLGPEVRAARGHVAGPAAAPERTTLLVVEFADGAVGSLAYSWEVPSPLRGLRMSHCYGTAGVIAFESNGLFIRVSGRRHRLRFPGFRDISGYRAMFTDFLAAVREDREPEMTLALARRDLALVEACHPPTDGSARREGR